MCNAWEDLKVELLKEGKKEEKAKNLKENLKKAKTLIKKFKSVKRIKELSIEELSAEIGLKKATIIVEYFNNSEKEKSSN